MESLQSLIEEACAQSQHVVFYNEYSGRGMYGEKCIGIVGSLSDCMRVISAVIVTMSRTLNAEFEGNVQTLLDFSKDSMGRDLIVYWPTLESFEEDSEELDE